MRFHRPYTTGELLVWRRAFLDDTNCHPPTHYCYRLWQERRCPTAPTVGTITAHFGSWAEFLAHDYPAAG